jgi:hypothetical protein
MDEQGAAAQDPQAPMVLRQVPPERRPSDRYAAVPGVEPADGTWWELVDVAAPADLPPAGVALTRVGSDGCVTVSALGTRYADAAEGYAELLRALVATLRSRTADTVIVHSADRTVARALLEVGFLRATDSNDGDRYLIVL